MDFASFNERNELAGVISSTSVSSMQSKKQGLIKIVIPYMSMSIITVKLLQ